VVAYYAHGKEQREVARHVRTGEKLEATEKNLHEAERFKKQKLGELVAELHGGPAFIGPQQHRVTINELLDALERHYKLRDKWNAKIESHLKAVRHYWGTWRAVEVTSDAVAKYIENLREQGNRRRRGNGHANSTINHRTQLLRQAFKVAMRNKLVSVAPYVPVLSEIGNERQGFFETADFEAVVSHLPEYLRDFARFGFITGWRKGSISTLGWDDVGDGVLYLRAKNAKQRKAESIPLDGELGAIIERRRAARILEAEDGTKRIAEFVFHRNGESVGDFRKAWGTACKLANFHDLRRTASRNMIEADVPQMVAMKITGHKTDSMFRRYAIVNHKQQRAALAKTQQYLAAQAEESKVVAIAK
jgi:integrase